MIGNVPKEDPLPADTIGLLLERISQAESFYESLVKSEPFVADESGEPVDDAGDRREQIDRERDGLAQPVRRELRKKDSDA